MMPLNLNKLHCSFVFSALFTSALAQSGMALTFPDQKFIFAYVFSNTTRKTEAKNESYAAPVGLGGEYSIFLSKGVTLTSQFSLSLDTIDGGIFLLGGGGGISTYLIGGTNSFYADNYLDSHSFPQMNLYLTFGLSAKSYNFIPYDREVSAPGTVPIPDGRDRKKGSFFAPFFALSYDFPLAKYLAPGLRVQFHQAIADKTSPEITILELWFFTTFII